MESSAPGGIPRFLRGLVKKKCNLRAKGASLEEFFFLVKEKEFQPPLVPPRGGRDLRAVALRRGLPARTGLHLQTVDEAHPAPVATSGTWCGALIRRQRPSAMPAA